MFYITRRDGSTENYYRVESTKGAKDKEGKDEKEQKHEQKKKGKADELTKVVAYDVMSRSQVLSSEDTLSRAWELILQGNFQNLPVISKEGKLVGILTGTDIAREIETNGKSKQVQDVMKTDVIYASDDTDVKEMAQLFFEKRVRMLPIVDRQSRVIGVVTQGDLLRTMVKVSRVGRKS